MSIKKKKTKNKNLKYDHSLYLLLIIIYITICYVIHFSHTENKNISQFNACKQDEFQCADGICILSYKRCNGIVDCSDTIMSDEYNCPHIAYYEDGTKTNKQKKNYAFILFF